MSFFAPRCKKCGMKKVKAYSSAFEKNQGLWEWKCVLCYKLEQIQKGKR